LCGDLAAEDALALFVGLNASEDVDLYGFEVEELDEKVEGFGHHTIVTHGVVTQAPK
jgi:hypothetical protein